MQPIAYLFQFNLSDLEGSGCQANAHDGARSPHAPACTHAPAITAHRRHHRQHPILRLQHRQRRGRSLRANGSAANHCYAIITTDVNYESPEIVVKRKQRPPPTPAQRHCQRRAAGRGVHDLLLRHQHQSPRQSLQRPRHRRRRRGGLHRTFRRCVSSSDVVFVRAVRQMFGVTRRDATYGEEGGRESAVYSCVSAAAKNHCKLQRKQGCICRSLLPNLA